MLIAGVLFAAFFSQPLLLLVVGGAVYRAFEKTPAPDMPPSYGVTVPQAAQAASGPRQTQNLPRRSIHWHRSCVRNTHIRSKRK